MRSLALILSLSLASCAGTRETMTKPDGSTYSYIAVQVGGAGESHGSSGAGQTFDGQKSFQDLLTGIGTVAATSAYKAGALAKEVTTRHAATQTTVQAKNAADAAVATEALKNSGQAVESGSSVLNNGQVLTAP